jgi:hypothetical protein
MGIGAIVLGIFAFICMFGGIVLTVVPFLGTMLSFLAPVLALAGIVLGGVALSRAKQGLGESEGLAIGGLVTSIVAFIPGMLVALTCGLCNTCVTGMYLDPTITAPRDAGPPRDAGVPLYAPIAPPPFPPALPPQPPQPMVPITPFPPGTPTTPTAPPIDPAAPTDPAPPSTDPAMPPPPLPVGPTTTALHPNGVSRP